MIYIAAPYSAEKREERRINRWRAILLGRMATAHGLTPIVLHPSIYEGVYGVDDDPEEREAGIAAACRIAARCDAMWALLRDDGTASEGVAREMEAFVKPKPIIAGAWGGFREIAQGADMLAEWERLT